MKIKQENRNEFRTIKFTLDQYVVVMLAIDRCRSICQDSSISKGRALELISADFMGVPAESLQ